MFALLLVACGPASSGGGESGANSAGGETASNQNAPAPAPYQVPDAANVAPREVTQDGMGSSPEAPLMACGPADSYRRVAEFRCADGSQPLGGDAGAGRQARAGNVGANSTGHVIDLYRVPCASGAVEVYVDMYGCPEMQQMFGGE